jgi:hypothetical protein
MLFAIYFFHQLTLSSNYFFQLAWCGVNRKPTRIPTAIVTPSRNILIRLKFLIKYLDWLKCGRNLIFYSCRLQDILLIYSLRYPLHVSFSVRAALLSVQHSHKNSVSKFNLVSKKLVRALPFPFLFPETYLYFASPSYNWPEYTWV